MKNNLLALNNYLFEELERLLDDNLEGEALNEEITRATAISKVGETIIRNGELSLKTVQYVNECGYGNKGVDQSYLASVPQNLLP